MSVTPIDVIDDSATELDEAEEEEGGATRIRGITSIAPSAPAQPSPPASASRPAGAVDATYAGAFQPGVDETVRVQRDVASGSAVASSSGPRLQAPPVDDTVLRGPEEQEAPPEAVAERHRSRKAPWIIGAVAVVVIGGGVMAATALRPSAPATTHSAVPQRAVDAAPVPTPTKLAGVAASDGKSVTFTWKDPSPKTGDSFLWGVVPAGGTPTLANTSQPTITVPASEGQTCLQVSLRRADGRTSADPATACVP